MTPADLAMKAALEQSVHAQKLPPSTSPDDRPFLIGQHEHGAMASETRLQKSSDGSLQASRTSIHHQPVLLHSSPATSSSFPADAQRLRRKASFAQLPHRFSDLAASATPSRQPPSFSPPYQTEGNSPLSSVPIAEPSPQEYDHQHSSPSLSSTVDTADFSPTQTPSHLREWQQPLQVSHHSYPFIEPLRTKRKFLPFRPAKRLPHHPASQFASLREVRAVVSEARGSRSSTAASSSSSSQSERKATSTFSPESPRPRYGHLLARTSDRPSASGSRTRRTVRFQGLGSSNRKTVQYEGVSFDILNPHTSRHSSSDRGALEGLLKSYFDEDMERSSSIYPHSTVSDPFDLSINDVEVERGRLDSDTSLRDRASSLEPETTVSNIVRHYEYLNRDPSGNMNNTPTSEMTYGNTDQLLGLTPRSPVPSPSLPRSARQPRGHPVSHKRSRNFTAPQAFHARSTDFPGPPPARPIPAPPPPRPVPATPPARPVPAFTPFDAEDDGASFFFDNEHEEDGVPVFRSVSSSLPTVISGTNYRLSHGSGAEGHESDWETQHGDSRMEVHDSNAMFPRSASGTVRASEDSIANTSTYEENRLSQVGMPENYAPTPRMPNQAFVKNAATSKRSNALASAVDRAAPRSGHADSHKPRSVNKSGQALTPNKGKPRSAEDNEDRVIQLLNTKRKYNELMSVSKDRDKELLKLRAKAAGIERELEGLRRCSPAAHAKGVSKWVREAGLLKKPKPKPLDPTPNSNSYTGLKTLVLGGGRERRGSDSDGLLANPQQPQSPAHGSIGGGQSVNSVATVQRVPTTPESEWSPLSRPMPARIRPLTRSTVRRTNSQPFVPFDSPSTISNNDGFEEIELRPIRPQGSPAARSAMSSQTALRQLSLASKTINNNGNPNNSVNNIASAGTNNKTTPKTSALNDEQLSRAAPNWDMRPNLTRSGPLGRYVSPRIWNELERREDPELGRRFPNMNDVVVTRTWNHEGEPEQLRLGKPWMLAAFAFFPLSFVVAFGGLDSIIHKKSGGRYKGIYAAQKRDALRYALCWCFVVIFGGFAITMTVLHNDL